MSTNDVPDTGTASNATQPPRAWLWVCALTIGLGVAAAVLLDPWTLDFLDARRVLAAGTAWAAGGDPYAVPGYFYTPALAVVASMLPGWSIAVLVLAEISVAVVLAPRHPLAIAAVLAWPPIWGDIALGNVTILLVGALVLAVRRDSMASGLLLGIGLALVPKPMFVPVLIWMAVQRRHSFAGIVLAGVLVTLPAALLTGAYPTFLAALAHGIDPAFEGNLGITTLVPAAGPAVSLAAVVVAVAFVRRGRDGLMVAAIAGTYMGTYVGIYAPVLPAGVLAGYAANRPRRAIVLGWIGAVSFLALPVAGLASLSVVALGGRFARLRGKDDGALTHGSTEEVAGG